MTGYEPVIGLEIHVQLNTLSKLFSATSTTFGATANSQASLIDLGFPGTLPVLNKEAVLKAIRFGIATNAKLNKTSIFERKNYFYPDLPKGYQTSQLELPIVGKGSLEIPLEGNTKKTITINRAHLEEDAGKSLHEDFHGKTGIDLNRAGIPLLEVVTEPELYSAHEAVSYMKTLHQLVKHIDICDGNMQEGSFRCDVNISLKPKGSQTLGTRTEIKNLNSFKFVEKAILYEIKRQTKLLDAGEKITQETRLYCPDSNSTRAMRSKEEAHDYRYFPCPDLMPVVITDEMIESVKLSLPKNANELKEELINQCNLKEEDANYLASNREYHQYFESVRQHAPKLSSQLITNWLRGNLSQKLNEDSLSLSESRVDPIRLGGLLEAFTDNTISGKIAKDVFDLMWQTNDSAFDIIKAKGLKQIDNSESLKPIVKAIIEANPKQAEELKNGKDKLMGFFVGQVMKQTKGQANPSQVNQLIKELLGM